MNHRASIAASCLTAALVLLAITVPACIWDSDTLGQERVKSPKLAGVILEPAPAAPDPRPLRDRIARLRAEPREGDPAWWNDLAGAHLRLGEARAAADLLAPVVTRFPDDYGLHANLGTALHLLGRYAEAAQHIARDLEINPEAHFGLEKYHLALLRYLAADAEHQRDHLYVDVWTAPFFGEAGGHQMSPYGSPYFGATFTTNSPEQHLAGLRAQLAAEQAKPAAKPYWVKQHAAAVESFERAMKGPDFAFQWELARDERLADGVIYLASLNREQPACLVMLGVVCLAQSNPDLNLAKAAFRQAIELNSPQRAALERHVQAIEKHQAEARQHTTTLFGRQLAGYQMALLLFAGFGLLLVLLLALALRRWRRRRLAELKRGA